jgi:hypothetical protein
METTNLGAVGISAGGVYNSETVYKKYKVVSANGGSYMYINPTPAAGVPVTDTSHWQQIASVGGQDILDAVTAEKNAAIAAKVLAQGYAAQLQAGTASPAGTYADLAALVADDPDHSKIYITLDDGKWCYHNGTAFVAGGVYQAASVVGDIASINSRLAEIAEIRVRLLADNVPNTTQEYTFGADGVISKVEHKNGATVERSDAFTFTDFAATEVRTLKTGESLTITTNLETLQTTVTYVAA